jgi:hypothetical protein
MNRFLASAIQGRYFIPVAILNLSEHLDAFLKNYLWADVDWLEVKGNQASYWQSRLKNQMTLSEPRDGVLHWNFKVPVVSNIKLPDVAIQVCAGLNKYAASWSYIFDSSEASIFATMSFTAPHLWDKYYIRASQTASMMSSISDRIANELANHVSGIVAVSFPSFQNTPREIPDGTYFSLEARMRRPEWHLDTTRFRFPPMEEITDFVSDQLAGTADESEFDSSEFRITTFTDDRSEISHQLLGSFELHPLLGDGFLSKLSFPRHASTSNPARICNELNLEMLGIEDGNHFGTWTFTENAFEYTQFSTTTEIRSYEDSPSFLGYTSKELWMLISTAVDALGIFFNFDLSEEGGESNGLKSDQLADEIISRLYESAKEVLNIANPDSDGRANHDFLWLQGMEEVLTTIHFNPIGPTISTYGLVMDTQEKTTYLLEISRHPMSPRYRVIDKANLESGKSRLINLAVGQALRNVPSAIDLLNASLELSELIKPLILERLQELEVEGDSDLLHLAFVINQFKTDPWRVLEAIAEPRVQHNISGDSFADSASTWLKAASDVTYLLSTYLELSNAWDGSLNFQISAGNQMGMFDTGPLLLIYNKIIGR